MTEKFKLRARHLNFFYGDAQALYDISMDVKSSQVTGADRAFRLREKHISEVYEPNE
jgi:ABC-type arginine transport system ATPase subunit